MSDEEPTEADHGAWIPFLIRKGRFTECIILAWQEVEDMVDQMTVQEFELLLTPEKQDPQVDILRDNVGFGVKLKFLKDMGRLSAIDSDIIGRFSHERNKLFHGGVFTNRSLLEISESERRGLMELARQASQIVMNRGFGVWLDEGTGDIGNRGTSKPEQPEAVKRLKEWKKRDALGANSDNKPRDVA